MVLALERRGGWEGSVSNGGLEAAQPPTTRASRRAQERIMWVDATSSDERPRGRRRKDHVLEDGALRSVPPSKSARDLVLEAIDR